jgi:hypothetical protein
MSEPHIAGPAIILEKPDIPGMAVFLKEQLAANQIVHIDDLEVLDELLRQLGDDGRRVTVHSDGQQMSAIEMADCRATFGSDTRPRQPTIHSGGKELSCDMVRRLRFERGLDPRPKHEQGEPGTAAARQQNLDAIAQFDPEVIAGAYWWGLNTQKQRDSDETNDYDTSPPAKTCAPGNCVGSGDCVDCCPDCDALRSDGFDDGPCERHPKAEMSEEEFKAWLTTQTREAAAKILKDLIVKEARAQGITGLHLREDHTSSFRVDDHRRVDTTPIRELLLLYHVAIDPAGLNATWTEEDGWKDAT